MADKRISELVNADALSGAESVEVVQGGVNKKTTAQDIANLAPGAGHVIEDEGTPLTARTKLNFVGAGVTVTDDAGDDATVVTIDGATSLFLGLYTSLVNLEAAHATASTGNWAIVDPGSGTDAVKYLWDEDEGWVAGGSGGTGLFADLTDDPRDNAALQAELEALEAADDTKANLAIEIRSITGSHTLDATDISNFNGGKSMWIKGNSAGTLTIPTGLPSGYSVLFSGFTAVVESSTTVTPSSGSLNTNPDALSLILWEATNTFRLENGSEAAEFVTLTYGATVNWDCENRRNPTAKVTATGDFAINMTNVISAAQGYLKIIKNTASDVTLTFDTDYTNKQLNSTLLTYTFSGASGNEYILEVMADGTLLEWVIGDVVPQNPVNYAKVSRTSSIAITDNTYTVVPWTTEVFDNASIIDLATDNTKFFIPGTGDKLVDVAVQFRYAANATGVRRVRLYLNGADTNFEYFVSLNATTGGGETFVRASFMVVCQGGDYIQAVAYQNSGSSINLVADSTTAVIKVR